MFHWKAFIAFHDDVIKWKHFPRSWPFVRGIHRSSVNSPHKGQWRGALLCSLICALNKQLSKQSWGWWFETQSRSLWRHCYERCSLFSSTLGERFHVMVVTIMPTIKMSDNIKIIVDTGQSIQHAFNLMSFTCHVFYANHRVTVSSFH